jgi:hypothetical protein
MRGPLGYIVLWLMGVPIGTLILIWIVISMFGR